MTVRSISWLFGIASICLAIMVLAASEAAAGNGLVTGVRGPSMSLYAEPGGAKVGEVSRRDGRKFKDTPLSIITVQGTWIEILIEDQRKWVQSDQAQISGQRPELSCGSRLGGSSAGASRGIGGNCKN